MEPTGMLWPRGWRVGSDRKFMRRHRWTLRIFLASRAGAFTVGAVNHMCSRYHRFVIDQVCDHCSILCGSLSVLSCQGVTSETGPECVRWLRETSTLSPSVAAIFR